VVSVIPSEASDNQAVVSVIPSEASDNQSQYEYQMNTGRYPMREMTHNLSPEVHVLVGTLVPVVSTTPLVVCELIGTTPSPSLGRCKNLPEVRVT
jgi:hypothetical protein